MVSDNYYLTIIVSVFLRRYRGKTVDLQGIQRYWLSMSLVHYMCCMHSGKYCAFEEGDQYFQDLVKIE